MGYVFSACVLTVQLWEFYNLFREIPALRFRETPWDLLGILAIVQAFALFESAVVFLVITALAALLPSRWFRSDYVSRATALLVIGAAWAIRVHLDPLPMTAWPALKLGLWLVSCWLAIAVAWVAIGRFPRLRLGIDWVISKTALLAQVYVAISLMGLVVILIRNL